MFKKAYALFSLLALLALAAPAGAHSLWLNLYESHAHKPAHAISSIGWGHNIPMDDLIQQLNLKAYTMYAPDGGETQIELPEVTAQKPVKSKSGVAIQVGDVAARKFIMSDEMTKGTYQVALATKDNFFTRYTNKKGRTKWAPTSMDQVKDAKKIVSCMLYKSYAKAYFTKGEWSDPKPLGHDLEIMPLTDLSTLRAGEKVEFMITFMGKPLNTSPDIGIEYITALSNTYGTPDKFMLASMIFGGKGSFRLPTAGQWVVNVYFRQAVSPESELKHMVGKCTTALYAATISFNVKP